LGGSRGSRGLQIRNIFIIFFISGFWHGANWTFIVWGGLNALFFLPLLFFDINRNHLEVVAKGKLFPSLKDVIFILFTFFITVIAWVFFRAENIGHAFEYLTKMFDSSILTMPELPDFNGKRRAHPIWYLLIFFILIEWIGREDEYAIEKLGLSWIRLIRWSFYAFIIFIIGMYMQTSEMPFIYFQF
jgi:hypothetical protein